MSQDRDDWDDQRSFLAVLRGGSLSAAARALGVTQPTIRRRLDALERSIGAPLFSRSPSGLMPTAAARDLAVHAEAMEAAAAAFVRSASAPSEAIAGTVRIAASDVVGAEVLPAMLADLRAAHPGLQIEIALSNRNADLLRQDADLAIRMARATQAALLAQAVGAVRLGLFAHRAYVERRGEPASIADLPGHALIGPDRNATELRLMGEAGLPFRPADLAIRTDSHLAQVAAIRAGLGIGIMQTQLAAREPLLVPILPQAFSARLDTWIVMHEDLRRVRRVRVAFDHLVASFSAYVRE